MASYLHQERQFLLRWAPYENCTAPSILHFPYLGLPDSLPGAILPLIVLLYSLQAFIILCSRHFLPALSKISYAFSSTVVQSTVISLVAALPELVVSIIGTFITEEDVGISAVIGTAVFNTLVIPAICAIVASNSEVLPIDCWSLTRDSIVFGISLLILAFFLWNDVIHWYQAASMILIYAMYLTVIQVDKILKRKAKGVYYRFKDLCDDSALNRIGGKTVYGGVPEYFSSCDEVSSEDDKNGYLFIEKGKSHWYGKIYWCIMSPVVLMMKYTIPTFNLWCSLIFSCFWLAATSYIISWMITVIGYKLRLPDTLMGLTILGIGVGLPELLISIEVAKKGKQTMALCNAIGSNIVNILLCLGVPWIVKMAVTGTKGISFNTDGFSYNCFLTFLLICILYIALALNSFVLDKMIGWFLLTLYGVFFTLTCLIEMNVFFKVNLPLCNIKDYFSD